MKLTINLNYRTQWGESVYIVGNITQLGDGDELKAARMSLMGYDTWYYTVEVPDGIDELAYRFIIKPDNGLWQREWGKEHRIRISKTVKDMTVLSHWQAQPFNKHYYSSAFIDGVNKRERAARPLLAKASEALISIAAPDIAPDEALAIVGDTSYLGDWEPGKAVIMNDAKFPTWEVSVPLKRGSDHFSYKFLIVKKETREVVAWENASNRIFDVPLSSAKDSIVVEALLFNSPKGNWRGAGTAIPVFSLRSDDDFGVGDFYDLYKMIDWAKKTGQNFVQILPINDTTMTGTWTDSYPYNANSTFALHPMFLRLEAVGKLSDAAQMERFAALRAELNSLKEVDYERVNNAKLEYLRAIYAEQGEETLRSAEYKKFVEENAYWLNDYAAFCVLRDKNGTADFSQWGDYATYDAARVKAFIADNRYEIDFARFLQYHLDKQLSEVRNYAHEQKVVLKGDIPIGISRTSVDAWVNPSLFHMDCQAGAPPDDFSVLGQTWGFPTYNWEEMAKDGYRWWKNRFAKMSQYFDAYRIDHILGFFRIWQIPIDAVHGLLGTFNPALPFSADELRNNYDFWIDHDLHTKPYIMEYMLTDFFGDYVGEVKAEFLYDVSWGRYGLREFVDTQLKVQEYFKNQEDNERNNRIRDGLLGLIDQVLFIEDPQRAGHYHPRVSAQFTYTYRALNEYEKWCFDRLYNDYFYRRHNDFWWNSAMSKLPELINSTDMLVCGEDLGMIPDCVPSVMNSQQILSLEIQRMPKDPKAEFGYPADYPYLSVGTTSTHDMAGIRGWWEEDREKTQHFFNNILHEWGDAPYFAEPWVCEKIIDQHVYSPSMLCIIPLQDWLSIDGDIRRDDPREEQINVPANSRHYWRYRMHLTLENLLSQDAFNERLLAKIKDAGR